MTRAVSKGAAAVACRLGAVALAALLALAACMPGAAWAYFSLPAIGLSFGTTAVSLAPGQTGTVAVICDKWSEQQLPGCGMAECPQACSNKVTPDGVLGGCLNSEGWCTCAGLSYTTAYTQLSVASSNPSVCRAAVSGSTLSLTAYSPGTATITVRASLSKHADAQASMTVNVSNGAGASGGAGAASGGSGAGGGTVTVTTTNVMAAAAAQAQATGEPQVVEMTAEDGSAIIVAEADGAAAAGEELAKIAGTNGTCTFWSGGTIDAPLVSLTFSGQSLDPGADLAFDPAVEVTRKGTGLVADLLAQAPDDTVVLGFAHSGPLPGPAEVYVRASSVLPDGTEALLFCFDEEALAFEQQQEGIVVSDGYAVFTMEHCSDWALSPSDLSALVMPEGVDASRVNVHAGSALPWLVGGAAVVVIAAVAVAGVAMRRRKAAAVASGAGAVGAVGAGAVGAAGAPGAPGTAGAAGASAPEEAKGPEEGCGR